jgi:hypothetical protein
MEEEERIENIFRRRQVARNKDGCIGLRNPMNGREV